MIILESESWVAVARVVEKMVENRLGGLDM